MVPSVCEAKVKVVVESVAAGAVTTGFAPVPLKATVCGEPPALSVIVSVPERAPAAVGVKVIEIVQLAPIARLLPQVLISEKSPETAIAPSVSAAVPELVRITVCTALVVPIVCDGKVRLVGESVAVGVAAKPVPLSVTVWGEPVALSVIASVPVRLPAAVGVNFTEIEQFAPAATDIPQVLVYAKSPDVAIELSASAACPVLVSVTICAALVVPVV